MSCPEASQITVVGKGSGTLGETRYCDQLILGPRQFTKRVFLDDSPPEEIWILFVVVMIHYNLLDVRTRFFVRNLSRRASHLRWHLYGENLARRLLVALP